VALVWGVSSTLHRPLLQWLTTVVLKWFVCSFFLMAIALSMAELASAAPTSGGLYYWTFKYSSPQTQRFTAWTIGCTFILSSLPYFNLTRPQISTQLDTSQAFAESFSQVPFRSWLRSPLARMVVSFLHLVKSCKSLV
jgi:amino acid permease